MSRFTILLCCVAGVLAMSGCGTSGTNEQAQSTNTPAVAQQTDGHATSDQGHAHAGGGEEGHGHADDHADDGHQDEESHGHDHAGHDHGNTDAAEIEEALAQLSTTDRALAEKQKICPVSEDPLGAMGKPIKLTVQGKDVFICCKGCEEPLLEEPEKYLAQLTSN